MNHARARAAQLHAAALRPARVTNRVVAPPDEILAKLRSYAEPKYGGAPKLNERLADPVVEQVKREDARAPLLEGGLRVPVGWLYDNGAGTHHHYLASSRAVRVCAADKDPSRGFYAYRTEGFGGPDGVFTNLYAAMLEYRESELLALVEKYTAARVNQADIIEQCREIRREDDARDDAERAKGEAKAGRVFEWVRAEHGMGAKRFARHEIRNSERRVIAEYAEARPFGDGDVAGVWVRDFGEDSDWAWAPQDTPPDQRRAWCERELNRLLDEREGKAGREQAAESLAPGWLPPTGQGGCYLHTSRAAVWQIDDGSWNHVGPCSAAEHERARPRDGNAPTRDEAMARALGWEPVADSDVSGWELPGAPHGMCVATIGNGAGWGGDNAAGKWRSGFPSLPHAIAWARGDA